MFTIQDAVKGAFSVDEMDLKAQVYLSICKKDKRCKAYRKSLSKISKMQRKLNKEKRKKALRQDQIRKLENAISLKRGENEALIEQVKSEQAIHDCGMVSGQLIRAYRQGLMIKDSIKRIHSVNSSYGRLVYDLFKDLSKLTPWGRLKSAVKRDGPSYFRRVIKNDPRLTKRDFQDTEEGALLIESHFIIYLLQFAGQDMSDHELKDFTANMAAQIGCSDAIATKISDDFKNGYKFGEGLSRGGWEVFRAVSASKALTRSFAKAAGVRLALMNIIWLIPAFAQVVNRRDYLRLTNSIFLLYLLRNSSELSS
jgi:hypothetical protein